MKLQKGIVAAILAVISTVGFILVFGYLFFGDVPERNADYFNMSLVALIGFVGTSFGYYMGSSDTNKEDPLKKE